MNTTDTTRAVTALFEDIAAAEALNLKYYGPPEQPGPTAALNRYEAAAQDFDRRAMLESIDNDGARRVMAWVCEWQSAYDYKRRESAEDHISQAMYWMHLGISHDEAQTAFERELGVPVERSTS